MTIARSVARSVASPVARPVAGGIGGGGIDQDAAAYFAAVEGAGGSFDLTSLDAAYTAAYVKAAHNTLFTQLKSNGLWSKITELYLLVGKTFDGITIKAKGTGLITSVNFVLGDYLAAGSGAGLVGDRNTKLLSTGLNRVSGGLYSLSAYLTEAGDDGVTQGYIGASNPPDGTALGRLTTGAQDTFHNSSDTAGDAATTNAARDGFFVGSARTSTDRELYRNGSSISTNTTNQSSTGTLEFALFAYSATTGFHSNARISFAHIGTPLTDTDAANLTNAVETFMDAIGAGVIA